MNETLQELQNLLVRSRLPTTQPVRFGMFVEIAQSLELDGATVADWQDWQRVCADTNIVHSYVARTLYHSTGAEVSK